MTGRSRRLGARLLVAALAGVFPSVALASPSIDYIYVDAGEGGSSGGHAALRIGDLVYHFEFVPSGLVRLRRHSFDRFALQYTLIENRTVQISRIPVSVETYTLMLDHFRRRHAIQVQHFEALEALRADRSVIQALLTGAREGAAASRISIDEARFFAREEASDRSPALVALQQRLETSYGPGFVAERRELWRKRLAGLDPRRSDAPSTELDADRPPPPTYSFAQRYRDALAALTALETLRMAPLLARARAAEPGPTELAFESGDDELVGRLATALEASLIRLAGSSRPDWGPAFLVGMARLVALERSRTSGRWVLLDASHPDTIGSLQHRWAARPDILPALLADARSEFAVARSRLAEWRAAGFPERDFAALEATGNRLLETLRTLQDGDFSRTHNSPREPTGAAAIAAPIPTALDEEVLQSNLRQARDREGRYVEALRGLYRYNLVTRNCVTEIFREMDRALAAEVPAGRAGKTDALVRAASRLRLGGHIDGGGALHFIPALSALAVEREYPVRERVELPAYRRARLARMYAEEPAALVFLRESNTLTSTVYRRHPDDSLFLFFTDDAVLPRPLFGVANLLTGLGGSAVGVVTLPLDGGRTFWAGLRGVIFSLPELFFFNIRKGSFDEADARLAATGP